MEYMELIDTLQIQYKDFTKRMKGRVYYDDQETKSLLDGYTEELASFISKELDKAREEGRREVLENELFIGDYDVLEQGLRIRTVDRENFLAQIYKTVKEKYSWAFGTATYKQALKMIENSLTSPLTPYVGTDKMVDEARVEVLSKLKQ